MSSLFIVDDEIDSVLVFDKKPNGEKVNLKLSGKINLTDFSNELKDFVSPKDSTLIQTPILPNNTVFYARTEKNKHIQITEIPPQVINYNYRGSIYSWALPYTYFLTGIQEVKNKLVLYDACVFSLKNPLKDLSEKVCYAPLGNIDSSHFICWGRSGSIDKPNINEYKKYVNQIINHFFTSSFNDDYSVRINYDPYPTDFYEAYEKRTKEDPNFINNHIYNSNYTVERLIENVNY